MDKDISKFLRKYGIDTYNIPVADVEEVSIDVTGQSDKIIEILEENSILWQKSSRRYGGASVLVSVTADYWTLLTMLYAIWKFCNTNVAFYVKIKGTSTPIKMVIADYLRYIADKISSEK